MKKKSDKKDNKVKIVMALDKMKKYNQIELKAKKASTVSIRQDRKTVKALCAIPSGTAS